MLFKSTYFRAISPLFRNLSSPIMGVASSPLWGPISCILSTTISCVIFWNRMYHFYSIISSNYGGRIQPALGTEFVYPIYYVRLDYSGIGCTIFTVLSVLIMGVASNPLRGRSSCILSTAFCLFILESDVPYLQYGQSFGELLLITSKIQSVHPFCIFRFIRRAFLQF